MFIGFHHEMAYRKEFASKVLFFCLEPPPEGGETSIVLSHVIVKKMEEAMPEFVAKLMKFGVVIQQITPKESTSEKAPRKTWQQLLQTKDKAEAIKLAQLKTGCNSLNFLEDGAAEFIFGPLNPIRKIKGRRVWFNTIVGYSGTLDDMSVSFGDGSPCPPDALTTYQKILDDNHVNSSWQKGDILLVDNLCVQHAGRPPRVILVSLCK
ncbi:clavaminate synthase-like protein At3g21360 [Amborella trichopoda]|uniref:clavaminate synthase-like protein At3g21360 n=1 Tax=Amborella trichopoda TaxID=13333 RepID=UPI0005D2E6CE|nr:clavaminate synthase-like protein At3g21360 [Amborella trichopoda]|eukprot:XP_011628643.1 clavaminate synthase-like protein At3g21360 [Amborella trichopoda]